MPFSLLSDKVFNHPSFGLDAMYYAGGAGAGVLVKYLDIEISQSIDILGQGFSVTGKKIKVRKADLSEVQDGDVFKIAEQKYYVKGEPETVRDDWVIEFGG